MVMLLALVRTLFVRSGVLVVEEAMSDIA
jgi:hypothetical protein